MKVSLSLLMLLLTTFVTPAAEPPKKLNILFLGDGGHHLPAARFRQLQPVLAERGITLTYTENLADLNPETLNKHDGLMVFANQTQISPDQEKALLDYVASGKGFIPLHCATYCFLNSPKYIDLVGAQFRSHTTGVFRTVTAKPDHPIMAGCSSFESWDETYVHHKHNEKDRTVLEYRVEGDVKEPWTWVRTHGKGRVFYTAWGHDQRTWSHQGFHTLMERGTRWACGQENLGTVYVDAPKMTAITGDKKDFEYVPAKVPFYPPSKTWGVIAEPIPTMQKPLPPEKSVKHYTTPENFEMKLFASDADFQGGKPMAMTWDERGRLWVTVTTDYPNELQKLGEGRDKIVILEDTDGDGKADKFTVFADKLSIPTSIICAHGGVIIHQAPHTLFLKDTDGDGKADVKQILMTGWATNDTHAGPSNLRYGFDNWYYGSVGYAGFNGTVNGERLNFKQGYYRFKVEANNTPDAPLKVTKLEFLRSTSNNTWGFAFNEDGQMFGSTANGCVLVHLPIPNRYYEKVRGLTSSVLPIIALDNRFHPVTDKVRQVDWHGGFTSAANCAIYTARTYPPEYWNKTAFVSDPTGHLTATFNLQPTGADFVARYGWNLVAAQDEWAAPIDAQVGPDGNMWVLDWYNFIVQHNPVPKGFENGKGNAYETPLRDKKHGRIYRVVYTKAKPEKSPDLSKAKPDQLVEALNNPNMLWRTHAQRLLVERNNPDVIGSLQKLVAQPAAVHASWIISTLAPTGPVNVSQGKSPSAAVRRVFAQTLPKNEASVAAILDANLLNDPDESVRLAALLALADQPTSDTVGTALSKQLIVSNTLTDKTLADGVTIAAASHGEKVLLALRTHNGTWSPSTVIALERIAATFAANAPATICDVLAQVTDQGAATNAIVTGITRGWPSGKALDVTPENEKKLAEVLGKIPGTSRGKLLKLASTWGMKGLDAQLTELSKGLLTTVLNEKAKEADRLDAAKQVVELRNDDDATAASLLGTITNQTTPQLAAGILEALGGSNAKSIGATVVAKLKDLPPSARPAALRLVLARPASAKAFLDAVEAGTARFDMLALDQKTSLSNHPDKAIAARAKKILALGGGLPDANRQKVIDEHHAILAKTGDVANGKKMFTTHCAKCHKHGAEGLVIGPDLTGFAVHPKEEILIAVLDPSRSVEGNYKSYTAKTIDGKVVTGLLAAESRTTVELLDAENKRHTITRDNIDELTESTKSLMPEGFEKQMKPEEIGDLLEFMTQKGKYVPISLDKFATVVSTKGMFFEETGTAERMIFPDWTPKTFAGVPFILTDPQGDKAKNVILLNGPNGNFPPTMPKSVLLPCNTKTAAIHLLSGVGGWNFPNGARGSVSMIVRLHYADGKTEDHPLRNGVHFADYINRIDVPESQFAFALRGQQIRYLSVKPKRAEVVKSIELVKGADASAPIVMAVTIETP